MPRPSIEVASGWRARTVVDRDGAPLGQVAHIYLDRRTREPEWALVVTEQGGRQVFVPLADAAEQQDQVRVPVERALVSNAPPVRAGRRLSEEETARLHGHYGGSPEPGRGSARRAPGGGSARLREGLERARQRVPSPPAMTSPRARRLLLAAGAVGSSLAGGVLLARRRRRPSGLAGTIGRTVGSVLAVPAGMLRRRRRRRRLRALAGTIAAPLTAAGRAVARTGRGAPVAAPPSRPPKRRRRRMAGKLKLLAGLAAGYVLGARAGRERYERIVEVSRRLAERPEVRDLTGKVRSGLGAGLERAAGTASDRLQQARGEEGGPETRAGAEAGEADRGARDPGRSSPEPEAGPYGRRPVRSPGAG